jgi:hypothetical protein
VARVFMTGWEHGSNWADAQIGHEVHPDGFLTDWTNGFTRGGWSRWALAQIAAGSTIYDLGANYSEFYAGFAHGLSSVGGSGEFEIMVFRSSGDVVQLTLTRVTAGFLKLYRGTRSGTLLATSTRTYNYSEWHYVEFYAKIHASTGAYEIRVDGDTFLIGSGANTAADATNVNVRRPEFKGVGTSTTNGYWDDFVMNDTTNDGSGNDTWPGDQKIALHLLNGDGSHLDLDVSGQSTSSPSGYTTEVAADSPKLYLKLAESSGTSAADSSGNAHNGTYTGSPSFGQTGLPGPGDTATLFDGVDDSIQVNDTADLDFSSAITIEAWFQRSNTGTTRLVHKSGAYYLFIGGTSGPSIEFSLTGVATFTYTYSSAQEYGVPVDLTEGSPTPRASRWHHIVATYNGSVIIIYVNGQEVARQTASGTITNSANNLFVGKDNGSGDRFKGRLAHIALYPTALSAARVQTHYRAGLNSLHYLAVSDPGSNNILTFNRRAPDDEGTYVYSSDTDDYDLYAMADVPSTYGIPTAIQFWARAKKDDAGAAKVALVVKSGASTQAGSDLALNSTWKYVWQCMSVDPTDSAAWTTAKANALELGAKVR